MFNNVRKSLLGLTRIYFYYSIFSFKLTLLGTIKRLLFIVSIAIIYIISSLQFLINDSITILEIKGSVGIFINKIL